MKDKKYIALGEKVILCPTEVERVMDGVSKYSEGVQYTATVWIGVHNRDRSKLTEKDVLDALELVEKEGNPETGERGKFYITGMFILDEEIDILEDLCKAV